MINLEALHREACRIIGEQSVMLSVANAEITRLNSLLTEAAKEESEEDSDADRN